MALPTRAWSLTSLPLHRSTIHASHGFKSPKLGTHPNLKTGGNDRPFSGMSLSSRADYTLSYIPVIWRRYPDSNGDSTDLQSGT